MEAWVRPLGWFLGLVSVASALRNNHGALYRPFHQRIAFQRPILRPLFAATSTSAASTSLDRASVTLIEPSTGCEVVLVGCFHGSRSSSEDVRAAIDDRTSAIVLELCTSRFLELRRHEPPITRSWLSRWTGMMERVADSRGAASAAAAGLLGGVSGLQTALGGLEPGLEFRTALEQAEARKIDIILADQAVDETLSRLGNLAGESVHLWTEFVRGDWAAPGREATALATAVLGQTDMEEQVSLVDFLTRSPSALRDVVRLLLPPLALIELGRVMDQQVWHAEPQEYSTLAFCLANGALLVLAYLTVCLPAVRVVLRQRDNQLTAGIRAACRRAGHGGRVIAVVGLLHVNGIAERLLRNETEA